MSFPSGKEWTIPTKDEREVLRRSYQRPPQDEQDLSQQPSRRHQQEGRGFSRESTPIHTTDGLDFSRESTMTIQRDGQRFPQQPPRKHQKDGQGLLRESTLDHTADELDFSRESTLILQRDGQRFLQQPSRGHQRGGQGLSRESTLVHTADELDFSRESTLTLQREGQRFPQQQPRRHQQGGQGLSRESTLVHTADELDFSRESTLTLQRDGQRFPQQQPRRHQQSGRGLSRESTLAHTADEIDFSRESTLTLQRDGQRFLQQPSRGYQRGRQGLSRESTIFLTADERDFSRELTLTLPMDIQRFPQQPPRRHQQGGQGLSRESTLVHTADELDFSRESTLTLQRDGQRFPQQQPRRHQQGGRGLSRESTLAHTADEIDFSRESTLTLQRDGQRFLQQPSRGYQRGRQGLSRESTIFPTADELDFSRELTLTLQRDGQRFLQQPSRGHQRGVQGLSRESTIVPSADELDFSRESNLTLQRDRQRFLQQPPRRHRQDGRELSRVYTRAHIADELDLSKESFMTLQRDGQRFLQQPSRRHQQGGQGLSRESTLVHTADELDFLRESTLTLQRDKQMPLQQSPRRHQQGGQGLSREKCLKHTGDQLDFSRESTFIFPQDGQRFSQQPPRRNQQEGRGLSRESSLIHTADELDLSKESFMTLPQDGQRFLQQPSRGHQRGGRGLSRESTLVHTAVELDFSRESTLRDGQGVTLSSRRPPQDEQGFSRQTSQINPQDGRGVLQQPSRRTPRNPPPESLPGDVGFLPTSHPEYARGTGSFRECPQQILVGKRVLPDVTDRATDKHRMKQPIQREETTPQYKGGIPGKGNKQKVIEAVKYGESPSFQVRVMVLGPNGSGKTTIIKRLKGERMQKLRIPTDGLEINESTLRCTEDESRQCFWENVCKEDLLTERIAFAMHNKSAKKENERIRQRSDTREAGRGQSNSRHEGSTQDATMQDGSPLYSPNHRKDETARNTYSQNEFKAGLPLLRTETDHDLRPDLTEGDETTSESLSCLSDEILKKAYDINEHSRTKKLHFSFWDFAGQVSYYGTHQLFMTPNTVNMLVVDLSKDLNDVLEDNMHFAMKSFGDIEVTVKESIEFWLQSIQMYTGKSSKCLIVVCTHIDKMTKKNIEKRTKDVQNILQRYGQNEYNLVILDNTKNPSEDEQLKLLQSHLYKVGQKISSKEIIPVVWMEYEFLLKREGKRFMTVLEVSELLINTRSPTEDDLQRLESFLCYQHQKGTLLFFPNNKGTAQIDPTRVALVPMDIVDFLNNIMFKPEVSLESLLKKGAKGHQGFQQDGIFDETYLDDIIKGNKNNTDLSNCKLEILAFLERIHVIFRFNTNATSFFFLPSLLRHKSKLCTFKSATSKSSTLVIAFESACRHFSVFFQLVAALSQHYEVVNAGGDKDKRPVPKHWYRNCAFFNIDKSKLQKLHVRLVNNDIYIEIFNYDEDFTFGNKDEVSVCQEVRSCIQEVLREVLDLYNTVLNFDLRIICPDHCDPPIPSKILIDDLRTQPKYICEDGPHVVKRRKLLKDWFHEEEQEYSKDQEHTFETAGSGGRVSNEIFEYSKSKGNNIPTDRDIGRICMMLHEKFIKPCCLATKLDIKNCHPAVDRIVMDNKDNQAMQLLEVLFRWKKENGTNATFAELARCLKTQSLTLATLVQVCLRVSTQRDGLPDKKLSERDLLNIRDAIVASRMDFLFLELGMQKVTIENTKENESSSSRCIFQLLKNWLNSSETRSSLDLDFACRAIKMDALTDTT